MCVMTPTMVWLLAACIGITSVSAFVPSYTNDLGASILEGSVSANAMNHRIMTRVAILRFVQFLLANNANPTFPGSSAAVNGIAPNRLNERTLLQAYFVNRGESDDAQSRSDRIARSQARTFGRAIRRIQSSNENTDAGDDKDLATAHFDSERIEESQLSLASLSSPDLDERDQHWLVRQFQACLGSPTPSPSRLLQPHELDWNGKESAQHSPLGRRRGCSPQCGAYKYAHVWRLPTSGNC